MIRAKRVAATAGVCVLAIMGFLMIVAAVAPRAAGALEEPKKDTGAAAPSDSAKADDAKPAMVVWDGTDKAEGQGWAAPEGGKVSIEKQADAGRDGKGAALRLRGSGKEWFGGGWNWRGWFPEDEGDDVRPHKSLVLWAKMTVENGEQPASPNVWLVSAGGGATGAVELRKYAPDLADGKWHKLVIPLEDLDKADRTAADAKPFDKAKAWEIAFGAWAEGERTVTLWVDDVGFDDRDAKPKGE